MVKRFLLLVLLTLPLSALGQALSVLGGDAWARECFDNANYAASHPPIVSRALLEPCDSALDYGTLSLADRAATYSNRGIIRAASKEITQAMLDYEKAMSIRPETPEIYVNRGNAYFLNRDYAMALEDYEVSLALGINQLHFVRYNMGMTYDNLGNLDLAEEQLKLALMIEPGWDLAEERLERVLEKRKEGEVEK